MAPLLQTQCYNQLVVALGLQEREQNQTVTKGQKIGLVGENPILAHSPQLPFDVARLDF